MYLTKNRNSNYYTRISLPARLKALGYPSEIRFSLHTKNRSEAIDRSVMVLHIVRPWIKTQSSSPYSPESIQALRSRVKHLQNRSFNSTSTASRDTLKGVVPHKPKQLPEKANTTYLNDFLEFKEKSEIRYSSISLLKTRISHFIKLLDKPLKQLTYNDSLRYEDTLLNMKNSYKTKKEYLSATKQFCEWLRRKQVIATNPLASLMIKIPASAKAKPSSQRNRWSNTQLDTLFKHQNFTRVPDLDTDTQVMKENFWLPFLLLYTGARSGEICQLKTNDVYQKEGIWCIDINDKGDDRHLKSHYASRIVPLHSCLIELGFIDYVNNRVEHQQVNLFGFKPIGIDKDWSKSFALRFSKVLNQCGFIEKTRPTLHSLRHTFIDELQQASVEEYITSELVGHSKQTLTYGRYGKSIQLSVLSENIEKLRVCRWLRTLPSKSE
ncbi:tyrosine-type recombinase/integrase [Vibrio sp. 10N.286.52.C3]|uniref:tyrosine-type recombinase/integrase n=1 Tax=unclassified Vibrio TaxID=2614977 RepID=UPI0035514B0F